MTRLAEQVVSGVRWQTLSKAISQIVSWGSTLWVMRLLAPADYGLMAMAMVVIGFVSLVAEMGIGASIVQARDVEPGRLRAAAGMALGLNVGVFALLAAVAPLLVRWYDEPRLLPLILALGLQLPLAALGTVPEAKARREMRFKQLSWIEMAVQIGSALVNLGGAMAGWGVWSLVAGQAAGWTLRTLALAALFGWTPPSWRWSGQRQLLRFGTSLTANRMIWYFSSQADVFIAGRLLSVSQVGLYAVALNLATMPMHKIMAIANQVAFSAFAKLQHDRAAVVAALSTGIRMVSTFSIGLLWGLAGVAPDLVPLLLGEQWRAAALPVQIIAMVVPIRIIGVMLSTGLIAVGHVDDDLRNTFVGACLLVPAFLVGVWLGGVNGLAIAWAVAFPLYALVILVTTARRFSTSALVLLSSLRVPMAAGAAMLGAIHAVRAAFATLHPAALTLAEVGAGAGAYLATVALLDRALLRACVGRFDGAPR